MILHLRGDSLTAHHLRFTVFVNGQCCGHLCMNPRDATDFLLALQYGTLDDDTTAIEVTGAWPKDSPR